MVTAGRYGQALGLILRVLQCHQSQVGRTATQVLGDPDDVGVLCARQIVILDVNRVPVHNEAALPHHLVQLVPPRLAVIDDEHTSWFGRCRNKAAQASFARAKLHEMRMFSEVEKSPLIHNLHDIVLLVSMLQAVFELFQILHN